MSASNKAIIQRLVTEVINQGRLPVLDELCTPELAPAATLWITSFRTAFPDLHMEIVELIAADDKVVARLSGSATHRGTWHGHRPTARRFQQVAEVYIFTVHNARIDHAWGLQDTIARMTQLGLAPPGSSQ